MEAYLKSLLVYFSAHPEVALVAIFAAAALEALAVIGTVIPGSSIVFVGGVLIGLNALDPWWAAATATAGAILGDGLSYWLGRHYRERIRTLWPIKKYPAWFGRGQTYFSAHGAKSVFFGRFLGPLRAIVPVLAGMAGMPVPQFYCINVASALAWAAAHLLPGVLFGASLQLAGAVSSRLVAIVLAIALAIWILTRLVRLLFERGWPHLASIRDKIVAGAQRRQGFVSRLLLSLFDPARAESPALLTAAMLLIGGAWLFLGVLEDVVSKDPLVSFDDALYVLLQGWRTGWADHAMVAVTEVGGPAGTIALVAAASAFFIWRRYWKTLGYWLAASSVAEMLVWSLKSTLERARPHNIYTGTEQFSFPSGHATLSIVIYGFMAFLLANGKTSKEKIVITLLATLAIVLISFSRLYLGVHWFSDVIGSLSLGLTWVALLSIAYTHHVKNERIDALPFSFGALATLALVGVFYCGARHAGDVERYAFHPAAAATALADWTGTGWRALPPARLELGGDAEEAFSLQWAAQAPAIAATLTAAGWRVPAPWASKAMLLWLLPKTPIEQLPVWPRFNHGEPQELTFVKILDRNERIVIRLWSSSFAAGTSSASVTAPIYNATLSIERLRQISGTVALTTTQAGAGRPLSVLRKDLQLQHILIEQRQRAHAPVLLIK